MSKINKPRAWEMPYDTNPCSIEYSGRVLKAALVLLRAHFQEVEWFPIFIVFVLCLTVMADGSQSTVASGCTSGMAQFTTKNAGSTLHTAHCTLHSTPYTLHTTHCILNTAYCILHTAYCILHTAHCTIHTAHWTMNNKTEHWTLYTKNYTLHTELCTLPTYHQKLRTAQCKIYMTKCALHNTPITPWILNKWIASKLHLPSTTAKNCSHFHTIYSQGLIEV